MPGHGEGSVCADREASVWVARMSSKAQCPTEGSISADWQCVITSLAFPDWLNTREPNSFGLATANASGICKYLCRLNPASDTAIGNHSSISCIMHLASCICILYHEVGTTWSSKEKSPRGHSKVRLLGKFRSRRDILPGHPAVYQYATMVDHSGDWQTAIRHGDWYQGFNFAHIRCHMWTLVAFEESQKTQVTVCTYSDQPIVVLGNWEDFLHTCRGKTLTKLDMSQACQQIELDNKSKLFGSQLHRPIYVFAFWSVGNPAIFQTVMEGLLQEIGWAVVYMDGILVAGLTKRSLHQHLQRYWTVWSRQGFDWIRASVLLSPLLLCT